MGEAAASHGFVLKPLSHQETLRGHTSHGNREQHSRASTGHGIREQDSRASTSHAPRELNISNENAFSSSRAKPSENLKGSQNLSATDLAQKNLNSLLRESTANGSGRSYLSCLFICYAKIVAQVILYGYKDCSLLGQIPSTSTKILTPVLSPLLNPETFPTSSSKSMVWFKTLEACIGHQRLFCAKPLLQPFKTLSSRLNHCLLYVLLEVLLQQFLGCNLLLRMKVIR